MLEQKKLEAINREIREIRHKLRKFQSKHHVSPEKQRRSPVQKIDKMENILNKSRSRSGPYAGLHHSQLDLIIGECLFSPLNYSPSVNYPPSSQKIIDKVHALKGTPHNEQDLPYDVEAAKKEFVTDVLKRKTKNILPQSSLSTSSLENSPVAAERQTSLSRQSANDSKPSSLPSIQNSSKEQHRSATVPTKKHQVKSETGNLKDGKAKVTRSPYLESMKKKEPAKVVRAAAKSSSRDSGEFDFLFDSGEKQMLAKVRREGSESRGGVKKEAPNTGGMRQVSSVDSQGSSSRRASAGSLEPLKGAPSRKSSLTTESNGKRRSADAAIIKNQSSMENPSADPQSAASVSALAVSEESQEQGYEDEFEEEVHPAEVESKGGSSSEALNEEREPLMSRPIEDALTDDRIVEVAKSASDDRPVDRNAARQETQPDTLEGEYLSASRDSPTDNSSSRRDSVRRPIQSAESNLGLRSAEDATSKNPLPPAMKSMSAAAHESQEEGYEDEFEEEFHPAEENPREESQLSKGTGGPAASQGSSSRRGSAGPLEPSEMVLSEMSGGAPKNIAATTWETPGAEAQLRAEPLMTSGSMVDSALMAQEEGYEDEFEEESRPLAGERREGASQDSFMENAVGDAMTDNAAATEASTARDQVDGIISMDIDSASTNNKTSNTTKENSKDAIVDDYQNDYEEDDFGENSSAVQGNSGPLVDDEQAHGRDINTTVDNQMQDSSTVHRTVGDLEQSIDDSLSYARPAPSESHHSDSPSNDAGDVLGDPYTAKKPPRILKRFSSDELESESDIMTPITTARNPRKSYDPSTVASTTSSVKTTNLEYYMLSRVDYQGSAASDDNNSVGSGGDEENAFSTTLETFIERQKSENIERLNSLPGGTFS